MKPLPRHYRVVQWDAEKAQKRVDPEVDFECSRASFYKGFRCVAETAVTLPDGGRGYSGRALARKLGEIKRDIDMVQASTYQLWTTALDMTGDPKGERGWVEDMFKPRRLRLAKDYYTDACYDVLVQRVYHDDGSVAGLRPDTTVALFGRAFDKLEIYQEFHKAAVTELQAAGGTISQQLEEMRVKAEEEEAATQSALRVLEERLATVRRRRKRSFKKQGGQTHY